MGASTLGKLTHRTLGRARARSAACVVSRPQLRSRGAFVGRGRLRRASWVPRPARPTYRRARPTLPRRCGTGRSGAIRSLCFYAIAVSLNQDRLTDSFRTARRGRGPRLRRPPLPTRRVRRGLVQRRAPPHTASLTRPTLLAAAHRERCAASTCVAVQDPLQGLAASRAAIPNRPTRGRGQRVVTARPVTKGSRIFSPA